MRDRTATETAFELPGASTSKPVPGVVCVYRRGELVLDSYRADGACVVGRDDSADLVIPDAGISRRHASLEPAGVALAVVDLDSRNGTYVNGQRLSSGRTLAHFGSVVRLGKSLLVVVSDVTPFERHREERAQGELLGGPSLDDVRLRIDTIAATTAPVLAIGETGTGKELVARALHDKSGRRGAFVALNCAAVPRELVDSELFGHARGSFSGASGARQGLFRSADGGTLFLDELGELPAAVQAKLLRVLETQEVRSVGEDRPVRVDVRIVAATNRDLDDMVESGEFRGDLLHRIAALRITLPALRERLEDIPRLCRQLCGYPVGLGALERLLLHTWPGNIRELKNVLTAAAAMAQTAGSEEIDLNHVHYVLGGAAPEASSEDDVLKNRVAHALSDAGGNVRQAASALGMSRSVLYETLRRLRMDPKSFRSRG
ncbi:MAG: sigma 54-interacting transcriptional regulator [Myxococcales bacterium]|nr:sigma 54-interacting transcriptional regulator [Myxococcales bacterium]MCB9578354.1 sigma 54-interacting transcriptional regulator [Polyangiaceae bacterium]